MVIDEKRYNIETINKFEKFIYGQDDEKYIVNIEYDAKTNTIFKFKQDPERGLIHEEEKLTSFLWMKNLKALSKKKNFYKDSRTTLDAAMKEYGVTIEPLEISNNRRIAFGYKYILKCTKGHNKMLEFFRKGGMNIYADDTKDHFKILKPVEQYLISTGKRLFKGLEKYSDVKRLTFDLETEGLDPETSKITLIGVYDNFGFQEVIKITDEEDSEISAIIRLFEIIDEVKPSVITSFNGFWFDFPFMEKRCDILGFDITKIAITCHPDYPLKFVKSQIKLGGEIEDYMQPIMFGYSIIDIIHAAKRASAIDSEMENTKLKYLCKYNKINKVNRVYVDGDKINKILIDPTPYWFDDKTGSYGYYDSKPTITLTEEGGISFGKKISSLGELSDDYQKNKTLLDNNVIKPIIDTIKRGESLFILNPNLDEELKKYVDNGLYKYVCKTVSNLQKYIDSFTRVSGEYIVERYLIDDLWETNKIDEVYNQASFLIGKLLACSYQRSCVMGNSAMWNQLMFAFSYENNLTIPLKDEKRDILGGLSRLVKTGYSKNIMKCDFASLYPSLQLLLNLFPDVDIVGILKAALKFFHTERFIAKNLVKKYKKEGNLELSSMYDRKQLPIKILINAFFGGISSSDFFFWADVIKGEFTTASGRQFLRGMNKFFIKKGYDPILMDTDGVNFIYPESAKDAKYIGLGKNYLVEYGKEYSGPDAHIAEFNDLYMRGEMGLSLEKTWSAGINFKRKNYALLNSDGSISKTGNSIKSRGQATYIQEFINEGLVMLLNGKGYDFVQLYYKYIDDIYNRNMPVAKLATKSKVKKSIDAYNNRGTNKNGGQLGKQAHMELAIKYNLDIKPGDVIYLINTGKLASHSNTGFDKKTGESYCTYIPIEDIENNVPLDIKYNVKKYIKAFNNSVTSLLVVFDSSVRDSILIENPNKKLDWLYSQLELVSGQPLDPDDQDTLYDIFTPEPAEVAFWSRYDYDPNIWHNEVVEFNLPRLEEVMYF